jgi:hypothetical protein
VEGENGHVLPDEYEAAFYADPATPILTPLSKLETRNRASNEPGDPHSSHHRFDCAVARRFGMECMTWAAWLGLPARLGLAAEPTCWRGALTLYR